MKLVSKIKIFCSSAFTFLLIMVFYAPLMRIVHADETISGASYDSLIVAWQGHFIEDSLYFEIDDNFQSSKPDYVIEGYQNYKDFIISNSVIDISSISGVLSFVPAMAFLDSMRSNPPAEAYPNKERAVIQEEYRKFIELGGDFRSLQSLTSEGFDTLKAGEYFFAVGVNEQVRFGREISREEVDIIVKETGKKPARANHAFLFHGQPVLTAGAFWVSDDSPKRITHISGNSGHYFYSNLHQEVREDISIHSNRYFKSLAWLLKRLHELNINHNGVSLSKM